MWSSRLTALEALHSRHLHFYTKYDAPSIKENGNMSLGIRNKISTLLSCVAWATMTISVKCCVSNLNLPIQLACRTWLAIDFLDWKLKLNQQQLFILDFFFPFWRVTLCRILSSVLVSEKMYWLYQNLYTVIQSKAQGRFNMSICILTNSVVVLVSFIEKNSEISRGHGWMTVCKSYFYLHYCYLH